MAITSRNVSFNFGAATGITQELTSRVEFGQLLRGAVAVLQGFDVSFSNRDDHHLGRFLIQVVGGQETNTAVRVIVSYLLRDWSGEIDDPYEGIINVIVIARID